MTVKVDSRDGELLQVLRAWDGMSYSFPKEAAPVERLQRALWLIASGVLHMPKSHREYIEARLDTALEIKRKAIA